MCYVRNRNRICLRDKAVLSEHDDGHKDHRYEETVGLHGLAGITTSISGESQPPRVLELNVI
jgi:hypothetical protein